MNEAPQTVEPECERVIPQSALRGMLQEILEKRRAFRFKAFGSSMSPFVKNGDVLTIGPLPPGAPGIGDIVAFVHPYTERAVVHRLIGRRGGRCFVKGDNTRGPQVPLAPENILGRVTRIERNGRRIWWAAGPGRRLIALLSRRDFLLPITSGLQRLRPRPAKGSRYA